MRKPKYSTEEIKGEIKNVQAAALKAPIALYFLRKEVNRRKSAGRPATSGKTRTEQVRDNVRRHRAGKKKEKK